MSVGNKGLFCAESWPRGGTGIEEILFENAAAATES